MIGALVMAAVLAVTLTACGGCLLLDATPAYITYNRNDITVEGPALTVQAWIAPRMFEWDDPYAADNGNDSLPLLLKI